MGSPDGETFVGEFTRSANLASLRPATSPTWGAQPWRDPEIRPGSYKITQVERVGQVRPPTGASSWRPLAISADGSHALARIPGGFVVHEIGGNDVAVVTTYAVTCATMNPTGTCAVVGAEKGAVYSINLSGEIGLIELAPAGEQPVSTVASDWASGRVLFATGEAVYEWAGAPSRLEGSFFHQWSPAPPAASELGPNGSLYLGAEDGTLVSYGPDPEWDRTFPEALGGPAEPPVTALGVVGHRAGAVIGLTACADHTLRLWEGSYPGIYSDLVTFDSEGGSVIALGHTDSLITHALTSTGVILRVTVSHRVSAR